MNNKSTEKEIHLAVCKYLDLQYPNVIYTSDPSGLRTSIGIAMELKRKRCKKYKIPDLIILDPNGKYKGMLIEIKTDLSQIVNKKGDFKKDKHVQEQLRTLNRLNELGYAAFFGCGFNHIKKNIDEYFNQQNQKQ